MEGSGDDSGTESQRTHYSKTTYELRLKSLWKASKKFVRNNPLPPATTLFRPLASSISVTRAPAQIGIAHAPTTTAAQLSATPTTTTSTQSTTIVQATPKLSRNQRCKLKRKATIAADPLTERLSRRQAKRAKKAERELVEQYSANIAAVAASPKTTSLVVVDPQTVLARAK